MLFRLLVSRDELQVRVVDEATLVPLTTCGLLQPRWFRKQPLYSRVTDTSVSPLAPRLLREWRTCCRRGIIISVFPWWRGATRRWAAATARLWASSQVENHSSDSHVLVKRWDTLRPYVMESSVSAAPEAPHISSVDFSHGVLYVRWTYGELFIDLSHSRMLHWQVVAMGKKRPEKVYSVDVSPSGFPAGSVGPSSVQWYQPPVGPRHINVVAEQRMLHWLFSVHWMKCRWLGTWCGPASLCLRATSTTWRWRPAPSAAGTPPCRTSSNWVSVPAAAWDQVCEAAPSRPVL